MPALGPDDHDLLIRLDTKMDMVLTNDADKERRLRAVERRLWYMGGCSGAIGVGLTYLLRILGKG